MQRGRPHKLAPSRRARACCCHARRSGSRRDADHACGTAVQSSSEPQLPAAPVTVQPRWPLSIRRCYEPVRRRRSSSWSLGGISGSDDRDHADAAVERARHLAGAIWPSCCSYSKIGGSGQRLLHRRQRGSPSGSTRGMFSSSPPPVMCARPSNLPRLHQRQQRTHVDPRRLDQRVGQRRSVERRGPPRSQPCSVAIRRTSEKPFECTPELARPSSTSPGATRRR